MRAVVQRVHNGSVTVEGKMVGRIDGGLVVLLGVAPDDDPRDSAFLAEKIVRLRIFEDDAGKMNRSVLEVGGGVLVVSQFTLLADCRKGRRPSFTGAAPPDLAETLYRSFIDAVAGFGVHVATGRFGATMDISLVNHGPVTLVVESR